MPTTAAPLVASSRQLANQPVLVLVAWADAFENWARRKNSSSQCTITPHPGANHQPPSPPPPAEAPAARPLTNPGQRVENRYAMPRTLFHAV